MNVQDTESTRSFTDLDSKLEKFQLKSFFLILFKKFGKMSRRRKQIENQAVPNDAQASVDLTSDNNCQR